MQCFLNIVINTSKSVCCYEKKSWSCKLRLKRAHLSLFFTDRLDQHQESSYEKKKFGIEGWGTAWMIEVHSGYSQDTVWCSAPIGSCWRFLLGWCISWAPDPSRSTDPWPPHRHWERERERTDAHRDTKVYGNINQLRGDKRRAEVKRSCNEKSNFPSWKHTVHKFYNWQLPSQSKNIIYWH